MRESPAEDTNGRVGELVHRISDDVKTIARDEIELVREELKDTARVAAVDAAGALAGIVVALIGLGMLCSVVVAALAAVIPPLWMRLLLMALVYLAIGGAVAGGFAQRLRHTAGTRLTSVKTEDRRIMKGGHA